MKTSMTKTMLLLMIAVVSVMMVAQIAKAGIANSKHDLSSGSTTTGPKTTGTDQICVFCHTPHFSSSGAPLWNRAASVETYTMYNATNSITMDMTVAAQPQGVSAACLSCHDGTVAFDSLLNKPGSGTGVPAAWTFTGDGVTNKMMSGASTNLGIVLTNDHPISITYDTTLAGTTGQFVAATAGKVGALPLYGAGKNQVECASCHNVHEPGTAGTTAPFLRASNAGSALCLTCHIK